MFQIELWRHPVCSSSCFKPFVDEVGKVKNVFFLCFVDRAFLYNLVNKANLVHNLFLVYLF